VKRFLEKLFSTEPCISFLERSMSMPQDQTLAAKLKSAQLLINSRFIKADPVFFVLANGYSALPNERAGHVLLWGPPGYGKSEITKTFFEGVEVREEELFQLSFGEDSDEAKLLGGLDLATFDRDKVIEYLLDNSFANRPYCIFEEILDAPGVVLCCLKDIFSSGFVRKGKQQYRIKTRFVVACTNMDPHQFSEGDDARAALIQRFPLTQKVWWGTHTASDYLELYRKCYPAHQVLHDVMANICADTNESREGKLKVSPRTSRNGMEAVIRQGRIFGRHSPEKSDFNILEWVEGFELPPETRRKVVAQSFERFGGHIAFAELSDRFSRCVAKFKASTGNMDDLATLSSEATAIGKAVIELKVPDDLFERKQGLLKQIHSATDGKV